MRHLDEETFQRALDGELDPGDAADVRAHLAECAECADRMEAVRAEEAKVGALLGALDHDRPALDPPAIDRASGRTVWRSRVAAGVAALVVGGGLAYAIPGSPVRGWVEGAFEARGPAAGPPGTAAPAGVAVDPGDSLDVLFEVPQAAGTVSIVSGAKGDVRLEVAGDAPAIVVDPAAIRVANAGSRASYVLRVPGDAPLVRVRVGGREVFVQRGSERRAAVEADASGRYAIPLR